MYFLAPWVYCYGKYNATFEEVLRDFGVIWELQASKSVMGNSVEAMEMERGSGRGCDLYLSHSRGLWRAQPFDPADWRVFVFSKGSQQNLSLNAFKEAFHLTQGKREGSAWWAVIWKTVSRIWSSPMNFQSTLKYSEKMVGSDSGWWQSAKNEISL